MKRKLLFILSAILLMCSFSSNKIKTVKGYIKAYGNDPFVYPAIKTEDNKFINIIDGRYSKEELLSYQSHLLEITGYVSKERSDNSIQYFMDIEEIKIIK